MMFKIGDKVKVNPSHIISDPLSFSHNAPYEIEAILSGGINLVLKGLTGFWGAHYFIMYNKQRSVGFTIE